MTTQLKLKVGDKLYGWSRQETNRINQPPEKEVVAFDIIKAGRRYYTVQESNASATYRVTTDTLEEKANEGPCFTRYLWFPSIEAYSRHKERQSLIQRVWLAVNRMGWVDYKKWSDEDLEQMYALLRKYIDQTADT